MREDQLKLPNGTVITFNPEQLEGLQKIKAWLKKREGNFFTLSGHAGSGKTTLLKKILDDYRFGVVVSAPTHKAKRVISNTTGVKGQTLHGLLGLRPDLDLSAYNPNNPQFAPIAIPKITDNNFVIIDEASMISKDLEELIKEKIGKSSTKVLYVGDPAQIPPVGEKESVVFNTENGYDNHLLTKVERQKDGNPICEYYDALRDNLHTVDGGIERITKINELGEGIIFTCDKRTFREALLDKFKSEEFKNNIDYCRVIAWKNETVMAANKVVRGEIIGKNVDVIEVGDVLMGYRSITDAKMRSNIIENGADYRVIRKGERYENPYGVMGFNVQIREDLGNGKFKHQDIFIIDSNDKENLHLYGQMHDFFRDMGKSNKKNWKKYYDFRRSNMLMCDIKNHANGLYREDRDIIVKDLDYSYAITCHKSQGSTYSYVFVMENDINDNWEKKERNQIKYVALTRPTISATVLTTKLDG